MIPVLLCGGSGTRLWPVSRSKMPKQFISLLERSLFELSGKRLQPLGQPYVVAVREFESLTKTFAAVLGLPKEHLLSEPFAKNTAPAIALITRYLELRGLQSEIVGVFPADHVIGNEKAFLEAVQVASKQAETGAIVTLGIKPNQPSTGFGYIELEKGGNFASPAPVKALRFREKPDLATAKEYLATGRFVWNAGIFFFKVSSMAQMFDRFAPDVWSPLKSLKADLSNLEEIYAKLPNISFDYAIMEKAETQYCVPCDPVWSDLGSWDDVVDFSGRFDAPLVPNKAAVFTSNAKNCYGYSEKKKAIAFVDVDDIVAIDTPDAMLIYKKGHSQNVRAIVDQLKKAGRIEAEEHAFEVRPWGRYEILMDRDDFKSKLIRVAPGQQISYQSHQKRQEHWVIVAGRGEVQLNEEWKTVAPGESVFIPIGMKHRIRNTGTVPLEFVEVQTGTYFGEDDIKRYQDDYDRK